MQTPVPQSEKYRVLRLVRRKPVVPSAPKDSCVQTVHFANAQGSLRVVEDQDVRRLARESTQALLKAIEIGCDTASV